MELNKKITVVAIFVSLAFAAIALGGYATIRAEREAWKKDKVELVNGLNAALKQIDDRFGVIEQALTQSMPVIEQSLNSLDERVKKLESFDAPVGEP